MPEKIYPYTAWVLMPSFKPKLETFVGCTSYGSEVSKTGRRYSSGILYETKAEAIAAGREKIKQQQAYIDQCQENLNKRIAALDRAERE